MQKVTDCGMVDASPQCTIHTDLAVTHPVTSTLKYERFNSARKLATALRASAPAVYSECQPPALAQRIGELDKGHVKWWLDRPAQTKALADFLEIPVEDLGVTAQSTSFVVNFSDFPGLKPLDLKREAPWCLGQEVLNADQKKSDYGRDTLEGWLQPNPAFWRPPSRQDWLQVDCPIEQQLLAQKLLAAGRFDVLVVPTLADAAEPLRGGKPLIVSVSASSGEADFYAMADRPDSAGFLVIAPFLFPVQMRSSAADSFYDWDRLALRGRERRKFEVTHPGALNDFKRWTWMLSPDWREKLLDWVGHRLDRHHPESLFTANEAQKWLADFDPQSVWFSTPSNLLQLCQLMNSRKPPKVTDRDCGVKLAKALFKAGPAYRHEQMQTLVQARWDTREVQWRSSLPMSAWLSLSPDALVAVSPAAIEQSASGKNLATVKKELAKLRIAAELGHADALLASGLIQVDADADGNYDFQHRTLATLLVRDQLLQQMATKVAEDWGWACFDEQRRPLVDAVLDAMSLEQLVGTSQRACAGSAEGDASAAMIGAREALFVALGRRIAGGNAIEAADVLPLARCVIAQLDMASATWTIPAPYSRPTQTDDDSLQWLTACWAWSLLPTTDEASAPDESWLFPGWCQALPETPPWVNELWVDEKSEPASPAWLQFLVVIDEWLKDVDAPVADAPRALHVGLLARAAGGRWSPDLSWWKSVNECRWAQDALIARLEALGARDAPQIALLLWPSWLAFERSFPDNSSWLATVSRIRRWLLGTMKNLAALEALNEDDLWYLARLPVSLPPEIRPLLFKKLTPLLLKELPSTLVAALEQSPAIFALGQEEEFFERFGAGIAHLLHGFLAHERLGFAAATCLWRWDAEAASQCLQDSQLLDAPARQHLLMTCPAAHLPMAVLILKTNPELFDMTYLDGWARPQLPNAGASAPVLLGIIRAAQAAIDNQA